MPLLRVNGLAAFVALTAMPFACVKLSGTGGKPEDIKVLPIYPSVKENESLIVLRSPILRQTSLGRRILRGSINTETAVVGDEEETVDSDINNTETTIVGGEEKTVDSDADNTDSIVDDTEEETVLSDADDVESTLLELEEETVLGPINGSSAIVNELEEDTVRSDSNGSSAIVNELEEDTVRSDSNGSSAIVNELEEDTVHSDSNGSSAIVNELEEETVLSDSDGSSTIVPEREEQAELAIARYSRLECLDIVLIGHGVLKAICITCAGVDSAHPKVCAVFCVWLVRNTIHSIEKPGSGEEQLALMRNSIIQASYDVAQTRAPLFRETVPTRIGKYTKNNGRKPKIEIPFEVTHHLTSLVRDTAAVRVGKHAGRRVTKSKTRHETILRLYETITALRQISAAELRRASRVALPKLKPRRPQHINKFLIGIPVELHDAPLSIAKPGHTVNDSLSTVQPDSNSENEPINAIPDVVSSFVFTSKNDGSLLSVLTEFVNLPDVDCPPEELQVCLSCIGRVFEPLDKDTGNDVSVIYESQTHGTDPASILGSALAVHRKVWPTDYQETKLAKPKAVKNSRLLDFFKSNQYQKKVEAKQPQAERENSSQLNEIPVVDHSIRPEEKDQIFQGGIPGLGARLPPADTAKPVSTEGEIPADQATKSASEGKPKANSNANEEKAPSGIKLPRTPSPHPVMALTRTEFSDAMRVRRERDIENAISVSPVLKKTNIHPRLKDWFACHVGHDSPASENRTKYYEFAPVTFHMEGRQSTGTPVIDEEAETVPCDWTVYQSPLFGLDFPDQVAARAAKMQGGDQRSYRTDGKASAQPLRSSRGHAMTAEQLHARAAERTRNYPDPFITRPMQPKASTPDRAPSEGSDTEEESVEEIERKTAEFMAALGQIQTSDEVMIYDEEEESDASSSPYTEIPVYGAFVPEVNFFTRQTTAGPSQAHRAQTPVLHHPQPKTAVGGMAAFAKMNIARRLEEWEREVVQPLPSDSPTIHTRAYRRLLAAAKEKARASFQHRTGTEQFF